jgi:hypothetical protein
MLLLLTTPIFQHSTSQATSVKAVSKRLCTCEHMFFSCPALVGLSQGLHDYACIILWMS